MIKDRLGENLKIDAEAFAMTSAVGATSQFYSMEGYDKALIVVSHATIGGNLQPVVTINQAANSTSAGAAITASSMVLGSTAAAVVTDAKVALITITTATTDGETLVINGETFTVSTAVSATAKTFGATAGSTAAGGADPIVTSLTSLINTYCTNLRATTASTATVRVEVKDGADTSIDITSTGGGMTPAYIKSQSMMEIRPSALNSTSRGFRVNISTIATALTVGLTIIREGAYKPASLTGAYSIATAVGT